MHGTQDCSGDAAAYVLGALERSEAEQFQRHLETCVSCRGQVQSLRHVVDALPMAAPQHPMPRRVRRRVLAEVRADAAGARRAGAISVRRTPWWIPRPALAGAIAVVVALAVGVGVELGGTGGPGTRVVEASLGQAELRVTGAHAELVVKHLPSPRLGRIYEVWIKRGANPPSPTKALFSVTSSGAGDVDVPGSVRGADTVMVTEEPTGGSLAPTSAPVIVAHL